MFEPLDNLFDLNGDGNLDLGEQALEYDDYMPLIMSGVAVWLIGCMGIAHYAAKVMCS